MITNNMEPVTQYMRLISDQQKLHVCKLELQNILIGGIIKTTYSGFLLNKLGKFIRLYT